MKLFSVFSLLLVPCLLLAQPQQSEDFRITKSVIDGGGAASSSADFHLVSAFGQPSPLGWQSNADFHLSGGFLSPMLLVSPLSPIQDLVISYATPDAYLNWTSRSGAHSYKIYRHTDAMFTPSPANFIGAAADTFFVDANVLSLPGVRYYYNVTASSDPATLIARNARQQTDPRPAPTAVPIQRKSMTADSPAKAQGSKDKR